MTLTILTIIVLRILHILGGIVWVGWGIYLASRAQPGTKEFRQYYPMYVRSEKFSNSERVMAISTIVTTVAGLLLFFIKYLADGNTRFLGTPAGMALSLGVLLGVLAFGDGIGLGRATSRYMKKLEGLGDSPTDEALNDAIADHTKLQRHTVIHVVLVIITVILMASFENIPATLG